MYPLRDPSITASSSFARRASRPFFSLVCFFHPVSSQPKVGPWLMQTPFSRNSYGSATKSEVSLADKKAFGMNGQLLVRTDSFILPGSLVVSLLTLPFRTRSERSAFEHHRVGVPRTLRFCPPHVNSIPQNILPHRGIIFVTRS